MEAARDNEESHVSKQEHSKRDAGGGGAHEYDRKSVTAAAALFGKIGASESSQFMRTIQVIC